jgi:cell division septation protein DedD
MLTLSIAFAQQPTIEQYVSMVEAGQQDVVREALPQLLQKYPNDPGVLYLQALLTTDGAEAVRLYQKIVDTYPNSVWADDALYKVYKFYYAIGLYRTAELKLDQLRTNYPNSKYISGRAASETLAEDKSGGPETKEPDTTRETPQAKEQAPPSIKQQPAPVTPAPISTPADVEPAAPLQRYTLQVGAYSTAANANRQKSFFDYHNYPADVVPKMLGTRELFVVYVGSFATEDEARKTGEELKRSYSIEYMIVKR